MRFFIKVFLLMILLSMSACSVPITEKGRMVRVFSGPVRPKNCKFIGTFEASYAMGNNMTDDRIQAKKSVQNKIGKAGGNTMYIVEAGGDIFSSTVQAEGYICNYD